MIYYVSDFSYEEVKGGAESCDNEILKYFAKNKIEYKFIKSENFNKNGEITNDQLNRALDATRENLTTPPFEITNIPGITSALRHGHSLDFYAGDELMGTILISESETGDRGDKPAWMRPYQHVRR